MTTHILAVMSSMKGVDYANCVLCGRKEVAPSSTNPLTYPQYGVCPQCTKSPDFDKKMSEFKKEHNLDT